MRRLTLLERFRLHDIERQMGGNGQPDLGGIFGVPSPTGGGMLRVIASAAYGWDHVSVSLPNRCPNWTEMSKIAQLFFKEEEFAMQLHVPPSMHINNHPYCLHWWRPHEGFIPIPPPGLVGVKGLTPEQAANMSWEDYNAVIAKVTEELKP